MACLLFKKDEDEDEDEDEDKDKDEDENEDEDVALDLQSAQALTEPSPETLTYSHPRTLYPLTLTNQWCQASSTVDLYHQLLPDLLLLLISIINEFSCMPSDLHEAFELKRFQDLCEAIHYGNLGLCLTPNGGTVLHVAAYYGDDSIIPAVHTKLLIQQDENEDTPLTIACREGRLTFIQVLIDRVKKKMTRASEGVSGEPFQGLLSTCNLKGNSPLHEAVLGNHNEIVSYLIEISPDIPYSCNAFGETPIFICIERGHFEVAKILLENLAEVNFGGPKGCSACHFAALHNMHEVVHLLLQYNKSLIKWQDDNGWGPLHYVASEGMTMMAEMLIEYDRSSIFLKDNKGRTPLHVVISLGLFDMVELLISRAPDCCHSRDSLGRNALHVAALYGHDNVLKYILKYKVNEPLLNDRDLQGNTPFLLLVSQHRLPFFIKHPRSNVWDRNKEGKTALDLVPTSRLHFFRKSSVSKELVAFGARSTFKNVREICVKGEREEFDLEGGRHGGESLGDEETRKKVDTHSVIVVLAATLAFPATYSVYSIYSAKKKPSRFEIAYFFGFIASNGIALLSSLAAISVYLFMSFRSYRGKTVNAHFTLASVLTILSVGSMDVAFATASLATLPLVPSIIVAVFSIPFFILYLAFVKKYYDF